MLTSYYKIKCITIDLVTTIDGFMALAPEKNYLAVQFIY
jgi:hypothetical protein